MKKRKKVLFKQAIIAIIISLVIISAIGIAISLRSSSSEPISGKAFGNLSSSQKQLYWKCMTDNKCNILLKEAQISKNYAAYSKCAKNCSDLASNIKPESYYCTDGDGTDFLTKSKVVSNLYPQGKEDYCFTFPNGKTYLMEGICKDNKYASVQKNCAEMGSYECKEGTGACKEKPYCLNDECKLKKLDFVVITRPMFIESLQEFVTWKKEVFGFKVGILTAEYIVENYEGTNMFEQTKNAIHYLNPKYALLVGDTEIVPTLNGVYTLEAVEKSYTLEKLWNIPTSGRHIFPIDDPNFDESSLGIADLLYTDEGKQGYDWIISKPVENFPGSVETGFTFNPKVYVGRWPVRTTQQLLNIINKTINFEPIKKFIFIRDSMLDNESLCLGWPINYDEQFQELYCYEDVFHTTYNKLFSNIPNEYILVNVESQEEILAAENKILFTPKDNAIIEEFHGSYDGIWLANSVLNSGDKFINSFPLFVGYSCSIAAFFYSDGSEKEPQVYTEYLIRSEKGPVVVISKPMLSYSFYQELLNGKTVGEAFYAAALTDTLIPGNPYWLFGDPSLVLYQS